MEDQLFQRKGKCAAQVVLLYSMLNVTTTQTATRTFAMNLDKESEVSYSDERSIDREGKNSSIHRIN